MFPFSCRPHTIHTTEQKQYSIDKARIDLGTLAGETIVGIFVVEICRTCLGNQPMHQNFKLRALYLSIYEQGKRDKYQRLCDLEQKSGYAELRYCPDGLVPNVGSSEQRWRWTLFFLFFLDIYQIRGNICHMLTQKQKQRLHLTHEMTRDGAGGIKRRFHESKIHFPAPGFDPTTFRPMNILLKLITQQVVSAFFRIQQGPSPVASTLGDLVAVAGNLGSSHECSREKEDGKKKFTRETSKLYRQWRQREKKSVTSAVRVPETEDENRCEDHSIIIELSNTTPPRYLTNQKEVPTRKLRPQTEEVRWFS